MPVRDKKIRISVVVVVEKLYAPAAHEPSCAPDAGCAGHVVERFVVAVAVHGIHFLIDVGHEEALPAVLIEIGGVYTHAGSRAAVLTECNTGGEANFFELAVAA